MDALQRAIPGPEIEGAMHRALRRKVLRQVAPGAAGLQNVKQPVDDLSGIDLALASAPLRGRDQRRDQRPFRVRQITGIAQPAPGIPAPAIPLPTSGAPLSLRHHVQNHK